MLYPYQGKPLPQKELISKPLMVSGLLLIEEALAVGAAGYGIARLIKKNGESKQETV